MKRQALARAGVIFLTVLAGCQESQRREVPGTPKEVPGTSKEVPGTPTIEVPGTPKEVPGTPIRLVAGDVKRGPLRGGEVRRYEIDLEAGWLADVTLRQRGLDAVLAIRGPDGTVIAEVDSPTGAYGNERHAWIVETSGVHGIDARGFEGADEGAHELSIAVERNVDQPQHRRAEAFRHALAGEAAEYSGDQDTAVEHFAKARGAWQAAKDHEGLAFARFRLGLLDRDTSSAATTLRSAIPLLREAGHLSRCGVAWHRLGNLERNRARPVDSREAFGKAAEIFRQIGDRENQARSTRALAVVHREAGLYDQTLAFYDQANQLHAQLGQPQRQAQTLHNRGRLYTELGDAHLARDDFEHALELWPVDRATDRFDTFVQLAFAEIRLDEIAAAEAALHHAAEQLTDSDSTRGALLDLAWGRLYEARQQPESALVRLQNALAGFQRNGPERESTATLLRIATQQIALGDYQQARGALREASKFVEQSDDAMLRIALQYRRAQVAAGLDEPIAARKHLAIAMDDIEAQRSRVATARLRSTLSARVQSLYELDIALLAKLHQRHPEGGYDAAALATSERGRARALVDLLQGQKVDLAEGHPGIARERQLWQQINAIESQRLDQRPANGERRRLELLRQLAAVQSQLRTSSPLYAQLTSPRWLTAREIQRDVLDSDTVLVELDLGEAASFAWVVTQRSLTMIELPPRHVLETSARRVAELLARGGRLHRAAVHLALEKLSGQLLLPLLPHLTPGQRLLVVADEALHYVPLGVLPIPGQASPQPDDIELPLGGVPLVSRHTIAYAPSTTAMHVLRQQLKGRLPAPGAGAVLADPVFQLEDLGLPSTDGLPEAAAPYRRLRHARAEADAILAQLSAAGKTLAALGSAANRDLVLDGSLSDYRVLHFATHGEIDSSRPELSRLVLALYDDAGQRRDGFLNAAELYRLHLPAELVVLSACRTALGEQIRGEGLTGLTQGFFYAGAARLVVSLWNVDDAASAAFMAHFYRVMITEGSPPAAALRQAKLHLARQDRWRDPFYWAGYVLQGEWRWSTEILQNDEARTPAQL